MKTYIVTPLLKKSFTLTTTYLDESQNEIKLEETYRSGTAIADLTESEAELLRTHDEWDYFDLFNANVEQCYDCCYNDVSAPFDVNIDTLNEDFEEDDRLITVTGPCEVTLYEE